MVKVSAEDLIVPRKKVRRPIQRHLLLSYLDEYNNAIINDCVPSRRLGRRVLVLRDRHAVGCTFRSGIGVVGKIPLY